MEVKNFRVEFTINGEPHHIDYSMEGKIDKETKQISAMHKIKRAHPDVNPSEIKIIRIREINIW